MPTAIMIDLSTLNPPQREAVIHEGGPLLVLAGAGSGKTRVITYRIAYLIGIRSVDPTRVMAVTFTNKAADEMLSRVNRLVPGGSTRPTVGTFHSTSLRTLRKYGDRLGYSHSFAVYDTADQMTLIRRCMRELNLNDEAFPPRSVLNRISHAKNELIGPKKFQDEYRDFFGARVGEVYHLYQKRLKEFDAMDFDDLIGKHVELLRDHEDVRRQLHARIEHLLIDEYQDTNHAQYALIRGLAGESGNVTAVGDEDQSIYRFRGADINNILNFERDFPGARVVKLEQNYRSTGNILDAATGVVSRNERRKGKTLFTDQGAGHAVRIVTCQTDREEAEYVLGKIRALPDGRKLTDYAVLFRTNAQSRLFEEELLRSNIPYTVVGGVKFYERAEIKDVMAYLRLAVRPHDTPSIERVINVPSRGVGNTTTKALDEESTSSGLSLWNVIEGDLPFLADRARKAVREFRDIVHDLQKAAANPLPELLDYLLVRTGYRRMYAESRDPQDEARLENIEELLNSAREFGEANPSANLGDYIDSITLLSDVDRYDSQKGVTLMTLHAAKGLEFEVVFLTGMEEGILPHSQSRDESEDIEEERRLCYVGMTRAKQELYCMHAMERRVHGQFREQSASPFLAEIPEEAVERIALARPRLQHTAGNTWRERPLQARQGNNPNATRSRQGDSTSDVFGFFKDTPVRFDPSALRTSKGRNDAGSNGELTRGSRVRHEQFGEGVILRMEGSGENAKLTVYFDRAGTRKFVAKYAKLIKL